MLNLITDVPGLSIGNAQDVKLISGVTVILPEAPAVASVAVLGGAPAGRDLGCLEPDATVDAVHAIVLSGGSGFGLDAPGGVQGWLREQGRGFRVGAATVPIVPAAVVFDLNNGGDKGWGRRSPYGDLGYAAAAAATTGQFALGSAGAGLGASTVNAKGGLGSASAVTSQGHRVGAIVVVNALGSALVGAGPHFWAAPLERNGEFGGLGLPARIMPADVALDWKGRSATTPPSTTIACIATDAILPKAAARRIAVAANAGLARALRLSHAAMDGDTIFVLSTGRGRAVSGVEDLIELGAVAADCLSRAIARGIYEAATPAFQWSGPSAWRDRFSSMRER